MLKAIHIEVLHFMIWKDEGLQVPKVLFLHWLYSPLGPWPLLSVSLQTVGLLGRVVSSSQGLYLNTGQHKNRINTYTHQISMSCLGLEPTISASERAKTVHALDRSATVTGPNRYGSTNFTWRVTAMYLMIRGKRFTRSSCVYLLFSLQIYFTNINYIHVQVHARMLFSLQTFATQLFRYYSWQKRNSDMEKSLISRSKCRISLKADKKSDLCSNIPRKNRKTGAPVTL
jgi:hypothetical protein